MPSTGWARDAARPGSHSGDEKRIRTLAGDQTAVIRESGHRRSAVE
jgi:hypothetical protein